MEIHRDIVVSKTAKARKTLDKLLDDQDRFIEYKEARTGYVYAWYNHATYVIFIAQETDSHTHIEGFAIRRPNTHCPHEVRFGKQKAKGTLIDLTGRNPTTTEDNIKDFISSFKEATKE